MSPRILLTIAYDGAPFDGWQSQSSGNGVQNHIERALKKITRESIAIHGAGRTDAGVHALAQTAHFDSPQVRLEPDAWVRAMNANLPPTIRVMRARPVGPTFHARFSAVGKVYRYRIAITPVLQPSLHQRAWHVPQPLDVGVLRQAMAAAVGTHDFRALSANRGGKPVTNRTRTIRAIRVLERSGSVFITFEGEGFLYKMVRMLVAAGVRSGRVQEPPDFLANLLANPSGPRSSHVAPADGLTLVRVRYR